MARQRLHVLATDELIEMCQEGRAGEVEHDVEACYVFMNE